MGYRKIIHLLFVFLLFFLQLLSGCRFGNKLSETDSPQYGFVPSLDSIISIDPYKVCASVDSMLSHTTDSNFYYCLLVLKAKSKLFLAEIDSSSLLLHEAEAYCLRNEKEPATRFLCADVYNMWGNIYGRRAVYDSAVWAFREAYRYGSEGGASEALLNICVNLADAYVRRGRFDLSSYWYNYSLSIADSLHFPSVKRFPIYYGLAQVNMELRDFNTCDYYYGLASKFYEEMQPYEKHIYLNNRGNSYYFRQDYEEALKYFRKSLALTTAYPEMEFERNLTMVNLGEVFLLLNQTDSASYYLHRCHRFFSSVGNASALYYIDTQLIELALKEGDMEQAKRLLRKTDNTAHIEPNMIRIRNRYLEHYFEAVGDYRNAYRYQDLNWKMDDSIRNERVKMRAAEIALRYRRDSTLMQQELFIEQKENQVLVLHQWLWGIISTILVVSAVAAVTVTIHRRKREKEIWGLQTAITSLRLKNIRNRISPHFIFNVLNREVNLHRKEEDSENLLELTKLLRRNLELTDKMAVSLADELDFVRTYVRLESKSLGEEFEFQLQMAEDIRQEQVMVPSMLLQISVENAIKHALRLKEGKRLLRIVIGHDSNDVIITVCDNGGGYRQKSVNHGTGTGMKVITQTIQLLNFYNVRPIVMRISNVPVDEDGTVGCQVHFTIPFNYSYILKN